jgi:glycosyltransferase involved in cell wall biosynthesis
MRTVYLIACHTNPEQVLRLVTTLRRHSPDSYILIHPDPAGASLDRSVFAEIDQLHIIDDPIPVAWGEFSLVEMELHCLTWLLDHHIPFDWLVFLSGQDYPIQPIAEIEQFLATTEYDGLMEHFDATDPPPVSTSSGLRWKPDTGFKRFFYRYVSLSLPGQLRGPVFRLGRWLNAVQSLVTLAVDRQGVKLGIRCPTPFHAQFRCYAGSQWHSLSYRCVCYIHEFVQQHPEIVHHYRHTLIPDESFFQTILLNQPQFTILNDNKRYIAWNGSKPAILQAQDFDRLIHSSCHFARKLDLSGHTSEVQLFDRLDHYLNHPSTYRDNRSEHHHRDHMPPTLPSIPQMNRADEAAATISLCICTMNRPEDLDRCLRSIFQGGYPHQVPDEIPDEVIISDDSPDPNPTQAVVANYSAKYPVVYQAGPRSGLGANRNACIRRATGSHILFVDDDVCVPPDFMRTVRDLLTADPDCLITGHEINHGGGQGRKVVPQNADFWGVQRLPVQQDYRSIVINATIFPRRLFDQARFDQHLRYGCDEIDIARHATALGYQIVYRDRLHVHHYPSNINRQHYQRFVHASRFYATTKAYWRYERSLLKAWIYLLLAPLQLAASGLKRGEWGMVWQVAQATITAYRYLLTYVPSAEDGYVSPAVR